MVKPMMMMILFQFKVRVSGLSPLFGHILAIRDSSDT